MELRDRLKTAAAAIAAAAAVAVGAAVLTAWSGVVNISADRGHFPMVEPMLEFGMAQSVRAHAPDIEPPPLEDPARIRLGAAHFQGGCAFCHSAPGQAASPVVLHMVPSPPDLAEAVSRWSDQELFFIVREGLKYAGMPSWPGEGRGDEVWSVVAFLRALPQLDSAAYRDLAMGAVSREAQAAEDIVVRGPWSGGRAACARCHEAEGQGTTSDLVPPLAGQRAGYLAMALRAYRDGTRQSGVMETVAAELDNAQIERIVAYYAEMPPAPPAPSTPAGDPARGEAIAREGVPGAAVPACLSCHGEAALPTYPRLARLSADYITLQLELWRSGVRGETGQEALMAPIAAALSEQQIADVSAWFASGAAE